MKYRREHFKVKVDRDPISKRVVGVPGGFLHTTGNGYQWSSIGFLDEELPAIIKALTDYHRKAQRKEREARAKIKGGSLKWFQAKVEKEMRALNYKEVSKHATPTKRKSWGQG